MGYIIILTLFSVILTVTKQSGPSHNKVVMCETLTISSVLRFRSGLRIENIEWDVCTHVVVIDQNMILGKDPWELQQLNVYDFKQLTNLRKSFPHLKVLLDICRNLPEYLEIASNSTTIQNYVKNAYDFVSLLDANGLNLRINEFDKRVTSAKEFNSLTQFIKLLKMKFQGSNLLLTLTITITKDFVHTPHHGMVGLSKHIDYLNIMQLYFNQPNYTMQRALEDRNITRNQENIDDLIFMGVSPSKVLMYICLTGPFFVIRNSTGEEKFGGYTTYIDICHWISQSTNYEKFESGTGLVVLRDQVKKLIILFESTRMIANEVGFAIRQGLGGFFVPVANDDFTGRCTIDSDTFDDFKNADGVKMKISIPNGTKWPVLKTINATIGVSLELVQSLAENSTNHTENNEQNKNGTEPNAVFSSVCSFVGIIIMGVLTISFRI